MSYKKFVHTFISVHAALFLFVLILAVVFFTPLRVIAICPVHFFLHLYCPFCGGTRALVLLLGGDVLCSLLYNPTALALVLVGAYYETYAIATLFRRDVGIFRRARIFPLWVLLFVSVGYCVVRNILLMGGIWDSIGELLPYYT